MVTVRVDKKGVKITKMEERTKRPIFRIVGKIAKKLQIQPT